MQKIGSDQLPLHSGESAMLRECVFHFVGARFERRQQIAMAALEIIEDIGQLVGHCLGIECQDPVDNMIRSLFVDRIEVARFGCRLERPHDHPCRIGAQIERLPVQERYL
jgi:hypothetical protein